MAILDKVSISGTTYDIADSPTRESLSTLKNSVDLDNIKESLLSDSILDTSEDIIFSESGDIQSISHTKGTTVVRTDTFTFSDSQIVEVRKLSTNQTLTITTDLTTLKTSLVFSNT